MSGSSDNLVPLTSELIRSTRFADNQSLPRWVMKHPRMIDIWREVNLSMSLSNDILSLKKEIKHGDIDNIVPVLVFDRNMTVQEAIAVRVS